VSLLRRRARARIEPPTEPFPVRSAAPWHSPEDTPETGMLIQVTGPSMRSQLIRARLQQTHRGTHWLLVLTYDDNSSAVRWVDLNHIDGWRYL
jgi:hypothetical protein